MSGNPVVGKGYMLGELWDAPIDSSIKLTKISD